MTTRDPRVLWPAIEPGTLQPSADAIGRAVAAILRGETASLGAADGRDAYPIGIAALLSGSGPLLASCVENGSLDVSESLAPILAEHLAHSRARVERMTRGVTPALSALVAAGVTPTIIKGFQTSRVYFTEPALRPIADIDVVVAPKDVTAAEAALQAEGFTGSSTIARPYKRDWFPSDDDGRVWSFELLHARDRWKIDLHGGAHFGEQSLFGFALDPAAISGADWSVGNVLVRVPAQPALTLILAAHLSAELRPKRLIRLIELVRVIRRDRRLGLLDWAGFEAAVEESGGWRFVYPALALVERLAPGTIDRDVLDRGRHAATRLGRLVADRFTPTKPLIDDQFSIAERLMYVVNARQGVRWLGHWLNPNPDRPWGEVAAMYRSRARRLISGRASLVAGSRPP
jgi:hypothetical protein